MNRIIAEIERVKQDKDAILDRKCIGLNSVEVVFLDTRRKFNLTTEYSGKSSFFEAKDSLFDPFLAGCYIMPGEISTLREIYIHALKCQASQILINQYYAYHYDASGIPEARKDEYRLFVPALLLPRKESGAC